MRWILFLALAAMAADDDPLLRWMDRIAQEQLDARARAVSAVKTREDAARRAREVRAKILESIGGLPDSRGPLNARTVKVTRNAMYTMEHVIYESLPGFYVTANLYLPSQPGRYPAVLMSAGHTTLGKTESHQMAANFAAKGFVALAYDPIGLGERVQAIDPVTRSHAGGCCANEHLQAGAQAQLAGLSVARYFIWDSVRSIDYLETRPEVDQDRIGAGGCSGGGCQTTYIAALDPRIKAAAPACFINSLRLLFTGAYPDSEMSLPRFLSAGLDHADFIEMTAPKPWLIQATEGDFFTPPAVQMVVDEARQWYGIFNARDRVQYFLTGGPHGTPKPTREALYAWMIRWLKDGKGDPKELDVPLYPDAQLQVTRTGQVEDEPGSRRLHHLIAGELRARRLPDPAGLPGELRRLGVPTGGQPPRAETAGAVVRIESEPGVTIEGRWVGQPAKSGQAVAIVLADPASETLARAVVAGGTAAFLLQPRDSLTSYDKRPYLGNWMANQRADTIGRNLPAMRAHDILRAVDHLGADRKVFLVARGVKGVWALLAAAADTRIAGVWLDRTPYSLAAAMDEPLTINLFDAMIPGFLLHWDLDDLARLVRPRKLLWTNPVDWVNRPVPPAPGFRHRTAGETDAGIVEELLKN